MSVSLFVSVAVTLLSKQVLVIGMQWDVVQIQAVHAKMYVMSHNRPCMMMYTFISV